MRRSADLRPQRTEEPTWWRDAVYYQVYVPSFADSNGDGVGDLAGIRSRLGYLELLGVDAIWLTPFYKSPLVDNGYDVTDPRDVEPLFGDLTGFDALLAAARSHTIRVLVDLVPNHTSDQHPWFSAALAAGPGSPQRDRYVFREGRGYDGSQPPNDWTSAFGGPAWTRVADGQWYLHLFTPEQPDLNWDNPDVAADYERTMRFWLDRGVDGFRVDAPRTEFGGAERVHEIHRMSRRVLEDYPGRVAVGEIGALDGLHLAFNTRLTEAGFDAGQVREAIEGSLAAVSATDVPATWALSNHDVIRHVTRYGDGPAGQRRARAMALVELALPGAVFVYNGDELGLSDIGLPEWALRDPVWERSGRTARGRDGCRVPMPWEGTAPPFGFSSGADTWLPMPNEWAPVTVEAQLEDPDSMLSLYRHAIELRKSHPAFHGGELEWYGAPLGCFAFRRKGGGLICALNTSTAPVPLPPGEVLLSSGPLDGDHLPQDTAVWLA